MARPSRPKLTESDSPTRVTFLKSLAEGFSVTGAAKAADVSRQSMYELRSNDAAFAQQWEDAYQQGTDTLEDEARRRAFNGVDKPIVFQGVITDTVKEYSDRLLELMLKSRRPDKYRERQQVETVTKTEVRDPELAAAIDKWASDDPAAIDKLAELASQAGESGE